MPYAVIEQEDRTTYMILYVDKKELNNLASKYHGQITYDLSEKDANDRCEPGKVDQSRRIMITVHELEKILSESSDPSKKIMNVKDNLAQENPHLRESPQGTKEPSFE